MELSCNQVVQFFGVRRVGEGESGEVGVGYLWKRGRNPIDGRSREITGRRLAEDEGEIEDKFLIV